MRPPRLTPPASPSASKRPRDYGSGAKNAPPSAKRAHRTTDTKASTMTNLAIPTTEPPPLGLMSLLRQRREARGEPFSALHGDQGFGYDAVEQWGKP